MSLEKIYNASVRDIMLIVAGSAVYAVGLNCFEVPNGLAAGGVAGLATITRELLLRQGVHIPLGLQVLVINVLIFAATLRHGSLRRAARTVVGIVCSTLAIDLLAPLLPELGEGDLILCALWGGAICGVGIGFIFRAGGNTGGTDILARILARKAQLSIGAASLLVDMAVVLLSVLVFGIEKALYATIALLLGSKVVDMVIDGFRGQRAALIISSESEAIIRGVALGLRCSVVEMPCRKPFSKTERPMVYVVIERSQTALLKAIVADVDPQATMVISEVYEAFGKGFARLEPHES